MTAVFNAIAYAHFKLRGGLRNLLLTSAGYAGLVACGIILTVSLSLPAYRAIALEGLAVGLLALQTLILVVFGLLTVSTAVKLDVSTSLIESHRLMRVDDLPAVCGYLVGAPAQAIALGAVNAVLGAIIAGNSPVRTESWLMANAVLFLFAGFLWSFVIYWGFLGRNAGRYIIGIGIASWISQGMLIAALPGLNVLASPMIGMTIFPLRMQRIGSPHAVSGLFQIALAVVFMLGAARRFRHPHRPALGVGLGLVLLGLCVAVSAVGMSYWYEFRLALFRGWDHDRDGLQMIASLIAVLLVAIVPVSAAARASVAALRQTPEAPEAGASLPPVVVNMLATLLVMLLLMGRPPEMQIVVRTGAVIFAFIFSISYMLRWCYLAVSRAGLLVSIWIVITWLPPLVIDFVRFMLKDDPYSEPTLTVVSGFSPLGAILELWQRRPTPHAATLGIGFQVMLIAVPAALYYRAVARKFGAKKSAAMNDEKE